MTDLQPQIDAALDRVDAKLEKLEADANAAAEASRWLIERLGAERDRLRTELEAIKSDGVWATDDVPCLGCRGKVNMASAALER